MAVRDALTPTPCRIMECGRLCKCADGACSNRATQSGINFRLQLFRTKHKVSLTRSLKSRHFVVASTFGIVADEVVFRTATGLGHSHTRGHSLRQLRDGVRGRDHHERDGRGKFQFLFASQSIETHARTPHKHTHTTLTKVPPHTHA